MQNLTLRDLPVNDKKVIVRVDFNIPLKNGEVQDDTRIRYSLPTLRYLLDRNARVILLTHLGRPKGQVKEELRLDPLVRKLKSLLGVNVHKVDDISGEKAQQAAWNLAAGEVLLLENVRFEPGEEKNDPLLAAQLANLGDVFVNDAFGTAHRSHASTAGIAAHLPSAAGFLLEKEIDTLQECLENPRRPLTVVLGGAKVSDKVGVIKRFLQTADNLVIGGGMANTFLAAKGYPLGASFYEAGSVEDARQLLGQLEEYRCKLYLPHDLVVAREIEEGASVREVPVEEIPEGEKAADIGAKTVQVFGDVLSSSSLVVWNGPLGVFEVPPFHRGTEGVARAAVESEAYLLLGGGDTVSAFEKVGLLEGVDYVSTGGGATLEFWEKGSLPGIEALSSKTQSSNNRAETPGKVKQYQKE